MFGRERRTEWRWQNTSFVPGGNVRVVVVQATDPSPAPHTVLVRRDGRTPPCSVCSQRTHVGAPGGPDVRQALERPVMLAYARRSRPIADGNRACGERGVPALLRLGRHVTVPAT